MGQRICSIVGCDRKVEYATKGLCRRCYKRVTTPRSGKTSPFESDVTRFEKQISPSPGGCWVWTGGTNRAKAPYGVINLQGRRSVYVHRWSYEYHRAAIPEGLEIDHLCHNTLCANPWHLEPVTRQINAARTLAALKTHCIRGHEFTPENTIRLRRGNGRRQCRACAQMHAKNQSAKRAARNRPGIYLQE